MVKALHANVETFKVETPGLVRTAALWTSALPAHEYATCVFTLLAAGIILRHEKKKICILAEELVLVR